MIRKIVRWVIIHRPGKTKRLLRRYYRKERRAAGAYGETPDIRGWYE